MEPKLPTHLGPERSGFYNRSVEVPLPSLEHSGEREALGVERREVRTQESTNEPTLPPPVTAPAINPPAPVPVDPTTPVADDTPLVANDDDLIEKEWVDKAKRIIANTRDDPYRRELEVGRLQADYLKKRYGKDLGVSQ